MNMNYSRTKTNYGRRDMTMAEMNKLAMKAQKQMFDQELDEMEAILNEQTDKNMKFFEP